ncbi:MAG: hydroxyacid dehydrogenase [Nanoarchaeota archaeon]|nr:hydroxyacid dehydrogenase [Nanoarchaeota archaeon]
MKTLITMPDYFDESSRNIFQELGEVDIIEYSRDLRESVLNIIEDYSILAIKVDLKIDKEMLDKASNLKVIASATTGVNHIDLDYAKQKGVEVIFLKGTNTSSTAEYVFAMLFSLYRRVYPARNILLQGIWDRVTFIGSSLDGKTFGIVGLGKIGRHVAKIANGFGMKVVAYDPYLSESVFRENNVEKKELGDLLKVSDVVTLHTFLNEETRKMFDMSKFKLMKENAVLINCSRGEIVNDEDLVKALKEKVIAGAALDVFDVEPIDGNHILVQGAKVLKNLIISPHLAGSTNESIKESGKYVAEKTKAFLRGS